MTHEAPPLIFKNPPKKKLCEITGADVPRGMDPDDLAEEECLAGACDCLRSAGAS